MAGRVLNLDNMIIADQLGTRIAQMWMTWNLQRQTKVAEWNELRRYIYATDTTQTTNSKLPWKNKTTIPKLCQIRDNLYANYIASMFPKRKWLVWEGNDKEANQGPKKEAIQNYMAWAISNPQFKEEIEKLVLDYIDYGNCFATLDWEDKTIELKNKVQTGYVGPVVRRISPLDIVMNPIAPSFEDSPKIVKSLVSLGEVKEMLQRLSTNENREAYEELYRYMIDLRGNVRNYTGELKTKNDFFQMDGFDNYRAYLESDYVELLTFYGDLYDRESDTLLKNHTIIVVDRHKVIHKAPNESFFGYPPIFHVGWRKRQDNLWAMGPLDNLVGMQYRIDHIENLKADVFDLTAFPVLKIRGYVEDFEWQPGERIYTGDDGDVELVAPQLSNILQANIEIATLENKMEELAGAPKEAMGFRTPGEKTAYEVQRLENAASRIFVNKIAQFEEKFVEKVLNGMLELARRKMGPTTVRVFDDEFQLASFEQLTQDDITGAGRIRPIAARHFAEKSERVQNLNAFFQSPLGQDPEVKVHWSSLELSKLMEDLLDVTEYKIVTPYIRLSEQADAQRQVQSLEEQVGMEGMTPSGLTPDDFDAELEQMPGV
jgi:hypothetical protein